ncbi:hypothetical protein Ddye_030416 [Dipteronia dyeriana]|uniref:MULE transposase domain-containing protein n=1 Tax=Dipteronia dyeriana TaxID=168575 RepID=A0AAD9WLG6_9ROSI|nr:hypothetical protein Ddye_030416 [Dipteronia dyeriana]
MIIIILVVQMILLSELSMVSVLRMVLEELRIVVVLVTVGGPSYDHFPAPPLRWILHCVDQYSFSTTSSASTLQEGPLFMGQVCKDKHKLKIELGLYAMHKRDGETDEAWTWFLLYIRDVIGTPEHLVVISDRHNNIANGMRNVYPIRPHCICYYHLKQNLQKEALKRGDVLQLYKSVTYSYRTEVYDNYLINISNIHCHAFDYPVDVGVERWSFTYCPEKRYRFMTLNVTKAINSASKETQKSPITTLVEFLRDLMQKWFHDQWKTANKGSSILTDFTIELIKNNQEKSQLCVV